MAQAKPGLLAEKQPFEGKVSGRVRYTVHPATSKLNPTFILGEPAAVDGDRAAASGGATDPGKTTHISIPQVEAPIAGVTPFRC